MPGFQHSNEGRTALTARAVAALKPRAEQYEQPVGDPKLPGFSLRVSPSGAKSWTLRYRIGRRMRRVSLGAYPVLSLKDARKEAKAALNKVAKGIDPAQQKQERRSADTFGELAERYIEKWALGPEVEPRDKETGRIADVWTFRVESGKPRKRSWAEDRRRLRVEVLPGWRHRPAIEIQRRDVRELVEGIARRGAPIQANRVHALLSKVFAFGIEQEVIAVNPARELRKTADENQRDRVLTEDEIRAFWKATGPDEPDAMAPAMRAFWRLRLLTAQRAVEVSSMRWADLDLEAGWWTIPAAIAKNGKSHRVPLSAPVVQILSELRSTQENGVNTRRSQAARKRVVYVLEGARGKRQQGEAAERIAIDNFRGHDLRRTAASYMASAEVPRLHISKVLNHVESGVTAVYDRHSYDKEKRVALDTLGRKVAAILEDNKGGAVVPFARR